MGAAQDYDSDVDVERETQAIGRRLLAASAHREPFTLSPQWWQERVLDWATSDPEFRVKLLRFVDVLPALRSGRAVADHIRQYFSGRTPALLHAGAELAGQPVFRPVVSKAVRQGVYAMAHRFIAGETAEEAVPRLRRLTESGVAYTVDLLGEATLSEAEADEYLDRYSELLRTLAEQAPGPSGGVWAGVPRVNVSIKLSSLYSQFEPAAPDAVSRATRERLRPLLRLARELGAFVNVDMEQYRFKDLTHRVFAEALLEPEFAAFEDAGIVVQAYLHDAPDDIDRLKALALKRGAPFSVRLVKGAYWEEERIVASQNSWPEPVFEEKQETDANYEACTTALLAAWPHLRPAFGTHNPRSIAQAMAKAAAAGVPAEAVEFQMLFGMAEELRAAVVAEGYRTRVYVPIGEVIPGMAYLVRRLLENTSNQSWFMRESTAGSPEEALAAPALRRAPGGPQAVARGERSHGGPEPNGRLGGRVVEPAADDVPFRNAAPAAFFLPEPRMRMLQALERVRRDFGREYPLLIGRERVPTRELDEVTYPADPSVVIARVTRATVSDAEAAVEVARQSFEAWRERPAGERAGILRRAAALLESRRYELAATMVFESAKPWHEADGDVVEAIDYLNYYAAQGQRLAKPRQLGDILGEDNEYRLEGRGVAAIIAPWNFPLAIICGMTAGALAAGCAAILKPAAQSPVIAFELVQTLREAGVPDGVVQYLPGPGSSIGQALVEHPGVDNIAFTGSREVGLGIVRAAAEMRNGQRNVKRVIAEMGGKNAIIVDDDADLDQAVAGAVTSAFGYAGQKCSACSRLVIVGSGYEEALSRLAAAVESLIVGPPHDPATFVPPVISAQARDRINGYIEAGMKSARLVAEGRACDGAGHYVRPTVFDEVALDDALARDEIFGPVLSVFRAGDFDEALEITMDSQFALTGGVYSRNPRHIEQARRCFRVGNLYINRKITGAIVGRQPFGGLAMSGVGDKAGGPDYLLQFMEPRVISENTMRRGFAPEGHSFHTAQ
jgi:RHH-type proline utilization regulon transcriptional repressor/proline dehydrogenase/delta 1-pyrroline-5-carboxylate dehydrogenase